MFPHPSRHHSIAFPEKAVGYPLGFYFRAINYYTYAAFAPHPDAAAARPQSHNELIAQLMQGLGNRWEREWLPSIMPGLERLRAVDYGAFSDPGLLELFGELRRDLVARWRIHGYLLFSYQAASTFDDFYTETFHPEDPTEPYLLLNGFETRSFESNRQLWELASAVRRSHTLRSVFEDTPISNVVLTLEQSQEGRSFLHQLRAYLDEYGWRSDSVYELAEPMWREDLRIPLNALEGLVRLNDAEDPDARRRRVVERRERLLEQARARLTANQEQSAQFESLYKQAQLQVQLDENHNFYIDQMGNVALRLPILELGRRLVRSGSIDQIDDVFMLTTDTIATGLGGNDQRDLVAARRVDMARWAKVTPPPTLGDAPQDEEIDPFMAAMIKLDIPPAPREQAATVIRGTPASPGTARGRAKVARSLEEASRVEPGQILVCEMTLPSWSVLFSTVAAVVADTGGVLSHCATIAREYGIPCVVGTTVGTTAIPDGAQLAVDGNRGEVTILS